MNITTFNLNDKLRNGFKISKIDDNAADDFKELLEGYPASAFFSLHVVLIPTSVWGEKYIVATYEGHAADKTFAMKAMRSSYKHAKRRFAEETNV
tara:strand:- start:20811 stop:21095 length:285 start_codon:yes stop_codon:yes gene_type:complete